MYKLSLAPSTIDGLPSLDLIAVAAAAGFDGVGVRLKYPAGVKSPSEDSNAPIPVADIKRRLRETGIAVPTAGSFWFVPETNVAEHERYLDIAAEIGAPQFQVVVTDTDEGRALANFSRTCEMAAARNIKIAIEFMAYTAVRSLDHAVRFIAASGQKNAGICLDALHLDRSGGTPDDVAKVDPKSIYYLQLCDAPRQKPTPDMLRVEARNNRLYPGEGELPLHELIDVLPPDIPLDLEVPHMADRNLPAGERAQRAADATRRFLAAHEQRSAKKS